VVDIGGRHLAAQIKGSGPTVLLEVGGGGFGLGDGWGGVDDVLAEFATVVTYDRAGAGSSEPHPSGRATPSEYAHDLAALLDVLPVEQPVIIAGWSMGGLIAQQFAALYPDRVRGLLLMDPTLLLSDPHTHTDPAKMAEYMETVKRASLETARRIREGELKDPAALAAFTQMITSGFGERFTPEKREKFIAIASTDPRRHERVAEIMEHMVPDVREVVDAIAARGLPRVPLIVLLSRLVRKEVLEQKAKSPEFAKHLDEVQHTQDRMEREVAEIGGEVRPLVGISHQIPFEAPEEVERAVRDLIARSADAAGQPVA
jgi:pimeloyl-ACP methyl ester carboxylesterase